MLRFSNFARSFNRLPSSSLHTLSTIHTRAIMDYDKVLKRKYPAKDHAKRVVEYIRSKVPSATGVLYLESRMTKLLEDNDEPEPFR